MHFSNLLRAGYCVALLGLTAATLPAAEPAPVAETTESAIKERPKLTAIDRLGETSRLEVHGGASFTIGGASGGGSFREYAGWASFYDPLTGISIGLSYANFSGNGLAPCLLGYDDYGYGYSPLSTRQRLLARSDYDCGTRLLPYPGKVRGQTTDVAVRLPLGKTGSAITLQASSTRFNGR